MRFRKELIVLLVAGCAKVSTVGVADAGGVSQPTVAAVEPSPGSVATDAKFVVHFTEAMDEGVLLAASGRSETVVLAAEAQVEQVAAAIEHSQLSAFERTLLIPAAAQIASDRMSIALAPDQRLPTGNLYLLVSPRLKDDQGVKLAGNGARFEFTVAAPPARAALVSPPAGTQAPTNLSVVRANAPSGTISLLAPDGSAVATAEAQGEVTLAVPAPLAPGAVYSLALDGAVDASQSFTAAACARTAGPALQPLLAPKDISVDVEVALDWPALLEVRLGDADDGEPCSDHCVTAKAQVECAPPPCGPQEFSCTASVHVGGLTPAFDYALRIVAQDDEGHTSSSPLLQFSTVAPLPRVLITEVMVSPTAGEYVELLNLGPGAADLGTLGLQDVDGVVRPLMGTAPPLPLLLAPGARSLAVGASFDQSLVPTLPPGTPVLRATAQRLLGRGLPDTATPAFSLVQTGATPVELSGFPAGLAACASGVSFQRDETVPPDGEAAWQCGKEGGTPGAPP
ncbi:MAG TPA: hypothetical protein VLW85_02660 [Myxococcales bacterium]|nr:hypothetical protein [Myxococcales bacterium]